ncbi:MAG TPA: hypothetical protein VFL59_12965 [Candidatus Nanopelagicales bacterium]|nr:hypothetical protein [Candidatus Nanopelagicales bacterium]
MIHLGHELLGGVLLPSSILSSPWYATLVAFVSLNTLIYVGLTIAKLTRWPRQVHPARVREARRRVAELPVVGPSIAPLVDEALSDGREQQRESERAPDGA